MEEPATPLNYVETRLEDQIKYYSKKGRDNKKYFQRIKVLEIVISVAIPALTGYLKDYEFIKYLIGIMGIMLAILSSLQVLFKYNDIWISSRITSEALKQEKFMFLAKAGPYKSSPDTADLVERVEMILAKENSTWNQMMNKKEETKQGE